MARNESSYPDIWRCNITRPVAQVCGSHIDVMRFGRCARSSHQLPSAGRLMSSRCCVANNGSTFLRHGHFAHGDGQTQTRSTAGDVGHDNGLAHCLGARRIRWRCKICDCRWAAVPLIAASASPADGSGSAYVAGFTLTRPISQRPQELPRPPSAACCSHALVAKLEFGVSLPTSTDQVQERRLEDLWRVQEPGRLRELCGDHGPEPAFTAVGRIAAAGEPARVCVPALGSRRA